MSRFILKILTADIPKTRRPGSDASSPIPVQCHRAIIAVNQREPVVFANNDGDRLHTSFRFVGSRLSQGPCQPEEQHYNTHWKTDLALLSNLQPLLGSPVLGRSRPNLGTTTVGRLCQTPMHGLAFHRMEPAGAERHRREARRVSELARANQTP